MEIDKKFEAEVRKMFNEICIVHDHQLGRVVGIHQDAMDIYYIVRVKRGDIPFGRELPEGGREYYASGAGHCSTLKGHERYEQLENMFTLNGCPPAKDFTISIDSRSLDEIYPVLE